MSGNVIWLRGVTLALLATTTLTACQETFGAPQGAASDTVSGQSVELVERDVEAPEVFQITESGLWDGRPSLGGVWVAHPDVTDPERVIIRNTTNGKFVIGALFRREREQPGPALQVSSDAAGALEMLAGAPAQLQVTALRREEAPAAAPAPVAAFDEPVEVQTTELDPIAGAEAAIAAAEAAPAIETTPLDAPAAAPAPEAAPAAVAAPTGNLAKPFVQIGIFSIQSNAERTAEILTGNGISARIIGGNSQGREFWRVVAGPANSADERTALLERIKGLGYTDAYAVTN